VTDARRMFERDPDAPPATDASWNALRRDVATINHAKCPACGFFNHPAATVRDDDRVSCCNCFELFTPQESHVPTDS
jgi:hypothetical protein